MGLDETMVSLVARAAELTAERITRDLDDRIMRGVRRALDEREEERVEGEGGGAQRFLEGIGKARLVVGRSDVLPAADEATS